MNNHPDHDPRQHEPAPPLFWIMVLFAALCLAMMLVSGCAVRVPIGQDARYGEVLVGYYPPSILNTPNLKK
ncbi:MAG: hypothetical protein ACOYNN_04220 [Terrimicrobiaceae bacterium]